MTQIQQKVYFITEEQRDALLKYLQERPYKEVANGVQFLSNAPSTILNVEVPEASEETAIEVTNVPSESEEVETIDHSAEALLSHV